MSSLERAEILFAVPAFGRGSVLGYRGNLVVSMFEEDEGVYYDPDEVFRLAGYMPGLYVWRGVIHVDWIGLDAPEPILLPEGQIGPATPEDVASLMGVAVPSVEELMEARAGEDRG